MYEFDPDLLPPFDHQRAHIQNEAQEEWRGLWWEQGTAKTRPIIDTACLLYEQGKIDGLLVVAVPGGERNWVNIEIPTWAPARLKPAIRAMYWDTGKAQTQRFKAELQGLIQHQGLAVLTIPYTSWIVEMAKKTTWKFLRRRRVMMVLDESSNIAKPGAKRTISIIAAGRWAKYRRVLDGTPVLESPFEAYSQIRFLDHDFWEKRGIGGYQAFKSRYGRWFTREDAKKELGFDPGFDRLVEYDNLEELSAIIAQVGTRYLKADVLDLPNKVYMPPREFDLTREQRNLYDTLAEDFMATFTDSKGRLRHIEAELAIQRITKFQQIVSGYVRAESEEPIEDLPGKNPRLELMEDIRDTTHQKAIVWTKFTRDIDKLMDMLGPTAARYDGSVTDDEAERSINDFQKGDKKWLVANKAKGSTTLTLHAAHHAYYYNNSVKGRQRVQSEDRCHRAGLKHSVDYTDLVARNTVDDKLILPLVRGKLQLSQVLMGDNLREFI